MPGLDQGPDRGARRQAQGLGAGVGDHRDQGLTGADIHVHLVVHCAGLEARDQALQVVLGTGAQGRLARGRRRASGRQFRSPGSPRDGTASANRDPDPDIAVQPLEDAHEPVDRKPLEPGLTDARKVSRGTASTRRRVANGEPFLVERLDDFRGQEGPKLA